MANVVMFLFYGGVVVRYGNLVPQQWKLQYARKQFYSSNRYVGEVFVYFWRQPVSSFDFTAQSSYDVMMLYRKKTK